MRATIAIGAVALFAAACGWRPPPECSYSCVRDDADGGCFAGPPMCVEHCGGEPRCPTGYDLVPDAGTSCAPIPADQRLVCL